jgi:catechol 2,3-dioxygenase-like lactoylglutathione lyase family enzyme
MCRGSRTGIAEPDHAAIAAGHKVTSRYRVFRTGGDQGEFVNLSALADIVKPTSAWSDILAQACLPEHEMTMEKLTAIEIKAFVPSRDFALSKQFYQDLGFELVWSSDDLAYLRRGASSFLLQKFYSKEHADNFMMHMIVEDVEAWWSHVQAQRLIAKYGVRAEPPADRPWGLRDFVIFDPTGVFWRMGQDIEPNKA